MRVAGILVFFGVFWSGMTLLFDSFSVVPAARQLIALHYPSTEGTVLSSDVTEHESDDGTTYDVKIRYSYSVGSGEYESQRYRYEMLSGSRARADYLVRTHPVGLKVNVYYNPGSPQDALLSPGVSGGDLFLVAFMTPFNAVMLAFWSAGLSHLRLRRLKPAAGGVRIVTRLRNTIVRLNPFSSLAAAIGSTALAAFLTIFIVGFAAGGFHPSLQTMIIAWTMIIAFGITGGIWHAVRVYSGKYDLVIDELGNTLELPTTRKRKERRRIPFASIENVHVATVEKPSSDGDGKTTSYVPTISFKDGPGIMKEDLVEWYSFDKANAFVEWLREKLPVKETTLARDRETL